ncbi:MAG: S9 family peptidase [Planctomycetes bacterium]|nr:S9 family peptidase [Planctomycetota bacterium]
MHLLRRTALFFLVLTVVVGAGRPALAQARRAMTIVDLIEVPRASDPQLSADGAQIAFTFDRPDWKANRRVSHLWRIDASGSNLVQLTQGENGESSPRWSPDGRAIAFLTRRGDNQDTQVYLLPTGGGEARQLSKHATAVSAITWAPDGEALYFLAPDPKTDLEKEQEKLKDDVFAYDENYKQQHLWKVAVKDGTEQRITGGAFSVLAYKLSHDGKKIAHHRCPTPLYGDDLKGEVWLMDGGGANAVQLTTNTVEEGGAELSPDGTQVLFLTGSNQQFKPNYRGSTGYGNAFLRDMVLHYFKNAHLDVMAGVDYLIKIGVADPDRLVKMGWSAGGHMTNKIITFTTRFKAASSGAGASNWISMYAQSDVRTYRTPWFGGTPWQKNAPTDVYWEHSPLKYISSVTTPTLFLVGQNDVRVPPPQSVEMYRALVSNGIPTHLYMAPREPHGWGELRHVLFKANVELDWFEKWAMGRTYTWEKAPGSEKK